jgi:HEPN domain-containing protein
MPNPKLALEWLVFAQRNLETAQLLMRENHYTDVIAFDIQQATEKALKAVYAFNNESVPRIHALDVLFNYANTNIQFKNIDIKQLLTINDYYISERYPGPKFSMPDMDEISESLNLAQTILDQVNKHIKQE